MGDRHTLTRLCLHITHPVLDFLCERLKCSGGLPAWNLLYIPFVLFFLRCC